MRWATQSAIPLGRSSPASFANIIKTSRWANGVEFPFRLASVGHSLKVRVQAAYLKDQSGLAYILIGGQGWYNP